MRWLHFFPLAAFAIVLSTTASIACSIIASALPAGASNVFRGEACGISYYQSPGRGIGLSEAEDLGGGFVWQVASDGNACVAEEHAVLIDCNSDKAVTVGPYESQGNDQGPDHVYAISELREFVREGSNLGDLSLESFVEKGASLSLPDAVYTDIGKRISLNGQLLGLSCACRLYYPDSAGARN